MFFRTNNLSNS